MSNVANAPSLMLDVLGIKLMKKLELAFLAAIMLVQTGCGKKVDLNISLKDAEFANRLESFFEGSIPASELVSGEVVSAPGLSYLEFLKDTFAKYGIKESYLIKNSDYHLAHHAAPTKSTLYFDEGKFYEPHDLENVEGVVIFSINGGGTYSLAYMREENGLLYLPSVKVAEQPKERPTPNRSYIEYAFHGLSHEMNAAGKEKLRAEIRLKSVVYGVPYVESRGIYGNSGIIWTAAGGRIQEATIYYFIEADEFEIKAFKSKESSQESVVGWKSEGAVQKGDSHTIDLIDGIEIKPEPDGTGQPM